MNDKWKRLCKSKVIDFWEKKLRAEADLLPSLFYFKPNFMSLSNPHPIWLHAGSPFEVGKAVVVARMLSGCYMTDRLARHWSHDNPDGLCCLPSCFNQEGCLKHILLECIFGLQTTSLPHHPSVHNESMKYPSTDPDCLFFTRTWCYAVHLARSKMFRAMNLR